MVSNFFQNYTISAQFNSIIIQIILPKSPLNPKISAFQENLYYCIEEFVLIFNLGLLNFTHSQLGSAPNMTSVIRHILSITLILASYVYANAEYFKHLSLQDGLSQPSVVAIKQDTLGRMWFGTKEGINVYDGHHITTYRGNIENPDGSRQWIGLSVSSIASDRNGNLYFSIGHHVIKYNIQTENLHKISNSESVSAITDFNGDIYAVAGQSVMRLNNEADSLEVLYAIPKLSRVSSLLVAKDGFYISTLNGLYTLDPSGKQINKLFPRRKIHSVLEDSKGIKWISLDDGWIYKMEPGKEPVEIPIPDLGMIPTGGLQTREAIEDSDGKIWFGSFLGLFCHDPATGKTEQIRLPKSLSGLSHSSIYSLLQDRNGNIWVGSYYGGVNYFNPRLNDIVNYTHEDHAPSGFFNSLVSAITLDKKGSLWIATDGGGVSNLDSQWNIRKQLKADGGKGAILQNNIKSIAYDPKRNRLYIGTHLGGLSHYDISSDQTVNYSDTKSEMKKLGKEARSIFINGDSLYLSTRSGIWLVDLNENKPYRITKDFYWRHAFVPKGNGDLYAYRNNALWRISRNKDSYKTKKIIQVPEHIEKMSALAYSNGNVYFAGVGVGLFRFEEKTGKLHKYCSYRTSLPSDYIYAMCSGKEGKIYITSDYGVTRFNPANGNFSSIKFSDIFPESNIIEYCGITSDTNGNIYVGSTKGLTIIPESMFDESPVISPSDAIYFSKLKMQDKDVIPDPNGSVLSQSLPFANKIILPHDHNSFSISLGFRDYMRTIESRRVKYKLKGYDNEWHVSSDGVIRYANLPAGKYTLLAQSVSADGKQIDNPISIEIYVENIWYASWWAKLLYFFILSAIALIFIINRRGRNRLHASLEKEKLERANIEQLNREKLQFYTNVSHEFQTPLTLIMSHIDILLSKYGKQKGLTTPLRSIRNNAESLGSLVMQLLEYRKLIQNKQILKIAETDIATIVNGMASKFNDYAIQRNITYQINTPPPGEIIIYCDGNLISKVVVNLISNAFKYTPDGGNISVEVAVTKDGDAQIIVSDTGKGMSSEEIPFIFERFYNGTSQEGYGVNYQTVGIGLAYVKSIIDKHHGKIDVSSKKGEGSIFIVTLSGNMDAFTNDENVNFVNSIPQSESFEEVMNEAIAEEHSADVNTEAEDNDSEELPLVMISEDNDELRRNIREYLRQYYKVETAPDGVEALKKIKQINPDIVVTDVLMPGMNGIDLCKAIKGDKELCHIPVIILTALSSEEHNLAGLQANVDDYMTKPFSMQMLVARIDNLLRNRKILQKQIALKPVDESNLEAMNPHDRKLLQQTTKVIDAHLSDMEFDIPALCREVGISRTLFYNKFKNLTGMTPNAFILNYRLLNAAEMLKKQPHMSVAEIGDQCGFNSTIYFSRCFKKQFGMSPQAYRKANSPENN